MSDPVARDVEREHSPGDAIELCHEAGLTVDRALQERQVAGCLPGEIDEVARDLLTAFDRVGRGADDAAAVTDRGGVGVEQADERRRTAETNTIHRTGRLFDPHPAAIVRPSSATEVSEAIGVARDAANLFRSSHTIPPAAP